MIDLLVRCLYHIYCPLTNDIIVTFSLIPFRFVLPEFLSLFLVMDEWSLEIKNEQSKLGNYFRFASLSSVNLSQTNGKLKVIVFFK